MVGVRVKLTDGLERFGKSGSRVKLSGFGPRKYQMLKLGQAAVEIINRRLDAGVGSDDAPMKPLSKSYKKFKERIGLRGVRDLTGSGQAMASRTILNARGVKVKKWARVSGRGSMHMLSDLRVTAADDRSCRIDISTQLSRIKARVNEQRAPWFGLSGRDVTALTKVAYQIFGGNIEGIKLAFSGVARPMNEQMPIWMDPLRLRGSRERAA